MKKPINREWDRHDIFAEVKRQGLTLTGIAKEAGIYKSACRQALFGNSAPGAMAIAAAIKVPFHTLFISIYPRECRAAAQTRRKRGKGESANAPHVVQVARRSA